ncbi:MAG: nucleotidyltransferase domain-containing protein [Bradymonadaceae bacterium]
MSSTNEIIRALEPTLAEEPTVAMAYMFGSATRDHPAEARDIDVAVWFDPSASFEQREALRHTLSERLDGRPVDLVALEEAPPALAYRVVDEGRLIFARDDATRVELVARIYGRYGDYVPVLKRQREQVIEGGFRERAVQRYREALGETQRMLEQIGAPDRETED